MVNPKRNRNVINIISAIFLVIIVLGLVWANFEYSSNNPGGNDFLVHWVAAKNFIYDGISPYSEITVLEIQKLVYGRAAIAGEHELRPSYPLYSVFLFLPFGLVKNYFIARALWMTLLEITLLFSVFISIKVSQWKPERLVLITVFVFSVFWYHGLRSLINGNVVVLLLFCLILSVYAVQIKQDELAGILLGLTTIKPQVGFALILFLILWGFVNKRYKIIFWFIGSTIMLIVLALFFEPNWLQQFLQEILRYPGYNPPGTPATALVQLIPGVGNRIGIGLSIISAIILMSEWFLGRKAAGIEFAWVCSITLVLGQWLNIQTDPGNFIIMLPAIFVAFRLNDDRWSNNGTLINFVILGLLFVIPWVVFIYTVSRDYQPIQSPIMFFPVPILLFIFLYWVRWWAKNPTKHVFLDQ
ncbi:MAG: hypothetical protein CVU46_16210 [Chloroflexi bacterium HGW-Chloroflexi-8]|nr:MAG: hypothetical protein CVU46_16210 [Chloroflexi bacterium HGW-Chloroflexi-8]